MQEGVKKPQVKQRELFATSDRQTSAQLVSKSNDPLGSPNPASSSVFIAECFVIQYRVNPWPVWVSSPGCVPIQFLAHPQPTHCGGRRGQSGKKRKPGCCASTVLEQPKHW